MSTFYRGAQTLEYTQILDGNIPFTFVSNSNQFNIVPSTITGLISKTENIFYPPTTDSSSKRYTLLLKSKTSKNYLTDTSNELTYSYSTDGYNLPETVVSKNYNGATLEGTTTTTTLFDSSVSGVGSTYYIGRPNQITTTTAAYGTEHTTIDKLFYTNGNITRKEKKVGTNPTTTTASSETMIETLDYFPNGNLSSKTTSATGFSATKSVSSRSESYTYDPTNRFIKTVTDIDGLVNTVNLYNPIYGLPTSQTNNTLAQTTFSIIDNWGKRTGVLDFLGKFTSYDYTKVNNVYRTTETSSDGNSSFIESDALSREIKKSSKNVNNNWSTISTEYDWKGRKSRESEPYLDNETINWSTILYDDYNRPIQVAPYVGKITTSQYNGLSTSIDDGLLIKITNKNSNGHTTSTLEIGSAGGASGGSISYTYDALGNLLTSVYDGTTVAMTYDFWGRKLSISDPSAGLYTNSYNAYGELINETTPKGFTDYTYLPTGKIQTKWVKDATTPVTTNMLTTYDYDTSYKWITSKTVVNPIDGNSTYNYYYDVGYANGFTNTKQLKKTVEVINPTGAGAISFIKEVSFDGFGRTLTVTSTANAHGKTSIKTTTSSYFNGFLYKIFDGTIATGNPIWQVNTVNARGQVLTSSFGNGLNISNEYDQWGYPKKTQHIKTGTPSKAVFTLENYFDYTTGNLSQRDYKVHENNSTSEMFQYDSLDRLTHESFISHNFTNFDSGTGNFTFTGSNSFMYNDNGKLKVSLGGSNASATKLLISNVKPGDNVEITYTLNIVNDYCNPGVPNLCNNATLYFQIYEKDPLSGAVKYASGGEVINLTDIYYVESAIYSEIYVKFFIVQSNNPQFTPTLNFTIDNIYAGLLYIDQDYNLNYARHKYHDSGKIDENYLGKYNYTKTNVTPAQPYQNTSITLNDQGKNLYGSVSNQIISYNALQRPIQIFDSGKRVDFGYNDNDQRMVMYYGSANTNKILRPNRKYYSADGSMEIVYTLPIAATGSVPAVVEKHCTRCQT